MSAHHNKLNEYLLISSNCDVVRRFQCLEDNAGAAHPAAWSNLTATGILSPVVVSSVEAAHRALHRSAMAGIPLRLAVVDSASLRKPGTDIAARLWARHPWLTVVDCRPEKNDGSVDEQLAACVQPGRFATLRVPFAKLDAALLIRNLIRSLDRDEQLNQCTQRVQSLQGRVEELEQEKTQLAHRLGQRRQFHPDLVDRSIPQIPTAGVGQSAATSHGPAVRRITLSASDTDLTDQHADSHTEATEQLSDLSDEARMTGRILVADDNPASLRLLTFLLERLGVQVTTCIDGAEALDLCQQACRDQRPFDAIVLDILMPELNGFECGHQIRATGYTGPVLAVTGHDLPEDRAAGQADCFDAWLTKPIDRNRLVRTLREMLAPTDAVSVS